MTHIKTNKLPLTSGTASILGSKECWRAVEIWNGYEGAAGYGDTKKQALDHLKRITAWRRT